MSLHSGVERLLDSKQDAVRRQEPPQSRFVRLCSVRHLDAGTLTGTGLYSIDIVAVGAEYRCRYRYQGTEETPGQAQRTTTKASKRTRVLDAAAAFFAA